jgi:hypothetical protein
MRSRRVLLALAILPFVIPVTLMAQFQRDNVPLKPWPAPLYWQPNQSEKLLAEPASFNNGAAGDTRPTNSLVFVAMTPCRVVDTRTGSGFTGAFGSPSLIGGARRTFPIQASATCSIPPIAQVYSFNITIVPQGFLDFITVWPTGQPQPNASTLNGYVNTVIANAAIVPAGTSGSVNVYASQSTDMIIDINGYYAQQTGITLEQGTAATPSLSFAGDAGTGIFSPAAGWLDIATGGTPRLVVASNGNVSMSGRLDVSGGENVTGTIALPFDSASGTLYSQYSSSPYGGAVTGYATHTTGQVWGVAGLSASSNGTGGLFRNQNPYGIALLATEQYGNTILAATANGRVGVGASNALSTLTVKAKALFPATGTVSTDGTTTTVTGSGTRFLSEVGIGDRITVDGFDKIVTSIASDTQLTTLSALPASAGAAMTVHPGMFRVDNSAGATTLIVNDQGSVLVGTVGDVVSKPKLFVAQTNPFSGTSTSTPAESQPGLTLRTNDPQGQDVGPMLGFSGQRGSSTNLFAAIRGAKENSTNEGVDSSLGRNGYLGFYTSQGPTTVAERMRITSAGRVGIGAVSPTRELEVNGGVRLNTATSKPACDATARGTFWVTQGGAGVKDSAELCAKDAADTYVWRPLY